MMNAIITLRTLDLESKVQSERRELKLRSEGIEINEIKFSSRAQTFPRKCTSRGALDFSFHRISTSDSQFPRFSSDFTETDLIQVYKNLTIRIIYF